ncbi:uncharacterized protein GGS22DRAFT_29723 [Annulohypoxylon maeteangense]|uniref:uncharacterized protein n=1 Tax=Annulohypoxylon maeteangense TaxID=1927788 RepID=UPI002008DF82|nr:uncharacterized protein GGS22DRAFT_29723 [Annulohypoxylon maeteangense]KAI0883380.1 hypothetical protein GGS22DRAFT_29723 [Annulohypoxylon maeteangense]
MGGTTHSPAASPAKGKGKAVPATKKPSGRGVTKRTGRKPAPKKTARGKGRGQKKVYLDPVTQAAYERQKELRDVYSQVANAVKPALEELANQSINDLNRRMDAHKDADEHQIVQDHLDERYKDAVEAIEREFKAKSRVTENEYRLERTRINKCFTDSFNYATDEFIDGSRNRASILDELRHEGCPTTTPDLSYTYVENIPYVSFISGQSTLEVAHALERDRQAKLPKRRAVDQLDEEPDSKKLRHTGGLLASEQQPDGVSESNAPSPTPLEEQEVTPATKKLLPDFPNGTCEPDEHGVRRVIRRVKSPANRFILQQTFQWEDDEIGFRDSTNDSTRRATRHSRGKFLNTPNSRAWHVDHTVKDYDCREYTAETLDPELVKKHRLHPKYGFFLPGSVNEPEPPSERVNGSRPIVHVPDRHTTNHASRSVRPMKMDRMLRDDATKGLMSSMLRGFCEEEDIDQDDIVTEEMREREVQARERLVIADDHEAPTENSASPQPVSNSFLKERVNVLLEAASEVDGQASSSPTPPSPRQSRPYDAVRDVFTGTEPATARPEQHSEAPNNPLDILAGAADEVSRCEPELPPKANQPRVDRAEVEPRGYVPHGQQLSSPSNFLQTALNPASTFTPIAPAPAPALPLEVAPQAAPHRNPFVNQNGIRDSPGLPPLRPNRSETLGKISHSSPQLQPLPLPMNQQPQEFGAPHGLVHTNSGTYYPPAPTRAYHQGLSFHEPPMMPMPISGQHIPGPGMMPNHSPLSHHVSIYHNVMSPSMHGQAQLAPMPQMEPPAPSISPPGPPVLAPSPPAHATRQRTSVSSNGNGAGRQFRRIAAAPASNNRPWQTNGGTELRLAHYDHKEAIKDYRANEPPPRTGPTTIRGWNVNNVSKGRTRSARKEDSEEKDSPK